MVSRVWPGQAPCVYGKLERGQIRSVTLQFALCFYLYLLCIFMVMKVRSKFLVPLPGFRGYETVASTVWCWDADHSLGITTWFYVFIMMVSATFYHL